MEFSDMNGINKIKIDCKYSEDEAHVYRRCSRLDLKKS